MNMGINETLKNPMQKAYLVVGTLLTLISILAVVLRFIATKRTGRKLHFDDWFALISLLLYLTFTAVNIYDASISSGRNARQLLDSPNEFAAVRKLIYSALWLYFYQQLFAKLSIIALYYRLFSVRPKFKWCINALVVYHVAWIIITSFLIGFLCQPLDKFWHPNLPGHCHSTGILLAVSETINSLGDFLLVAIAVVIVSILQTSRATKARLVGVFGLGVLAGTVGFVKIGLSFSNDPVYVFTLVAIWSNIQAGVAIVCCCAPVYKPLFPSSGLWSRFATKLSFSFSMPRISKPQPDTGRSNGSRPRPNRQDRHQYWLQREDGNSMGLAWSDMPRNDDGWTTDEGHHLQAIQVRKDIEISR